QAEDGIRDRNVTGVQTCALPIFTLNEVRREEGGEFDEPEEDQFIVANLTIENEGDDEENISSIMNIELKDDEGYSYTTTILTEGTKGQLDGAIEPDRKSTRLNSSHVSIS